jgi:NAD(P)-dependent dehydrogenase (short-subunit alcohol dehydrogenase family)
MPGAPDSPQLIGTDPARSLVDGLGAEFHGVPCIVLDASWSDGTRLEEWRDGACAGRTVKSLVVALWPSRPIRRTLVELDLGEWVGTVETRLAWWFAALAAASERCAEGGQVVAVVDRPDPKDSAGWGVESAVADAVDVMARSLAQLHRPRGVRVNVVATPVRLTGGPVPNLIGVIGAVRMLLSDDAGGVTATTVVAGGGD